jgi:hypothetical protein
MLSPDAAETLPRLYENIIIKPINNKVNIINLFLIIALSFIEKIALFYKFFHSLTVFLARILELYYSLILPIAD